jgi:hypothetical protein
MLVYKIARLVFLFCTLIHPNKILTYPPLIIAKFRRKDGPGRIALRKINAENRLVVNMTRRIVPSRIPAVLFSLLAIAFLSGCQKPTVNFGQAFINSNNTNIIVIDTATMALSTVQVDSFPTTATGNLLIGRYLDPEFGVISSKTYLQVGPPGNIPVISNVAGYDSLVLIMRSNKNFYGDTTQLQRYVVSQLQSVILLPPTQFTFYNNSGFPYDSTNQLGHSDVIVSPGTPFTSQHYNDSLKIRIQDVMGQSLFNLLQNQSDTIKNLPQFISYFKGLVIYPDGNSVGGIYGFRDSITLRLFYHEPGVVLTPKFVDFGINNKSNQFNHIAWKRTGTPLALLDTLMGNSKDTVSPEVASAQTGFASYIQSATGVEMKIRFPYLWKLPQLQDYLGVLKAILIVKPVIGSYSPLFSLPSQLFLYQTDQNNQLGPALPGNGSLSVDYIYGANTQYTYDLTAYIKQQIIAGPFSNQNSGLILTQPSPQTNTTFNRTIIGDRLNPKTNIQLKIYYASFF